VICIFSKYIRTIEGWTEDQFSHKYFALPVFPGQGALTQLFLTALRPSDSSEEKDVAKIPMTRLVHTAESPYTDL